MDYVWLAANEPGWPQVEDYNQYMRREQLGLLYRTGFFRDMSVPNLVSTTTPLWSGIPQIVDPPLYHFLVSLPLRLLRQTDLAVQYTVGRLVSFCFYLLSIWLAVLVSRELAPPGHPLRWMVPFSLAALPAYADLMTALNNDSAAVALFSLWILAAVRLVRRGFNLLDLALLVVSAGLCLVTKKSVWLALPMSALALLLAGLRGRRLAWLALIIPGMLVGLLVLFHNNDAGLWLRASMQVTPTHTDSTVVPGTHGAVRLDVGSGEVWPAVYQLVDLKTMQTLQGQTVTLGAWVWSDRETTANQPGLAVVDPLYQMTTRLPAASVGPEPRFVSAQFTIPADTARLRLLLSPQTGPSDSPGPVYYTGITMALGAFPTDAAPVLSDDGRTGTWAGQVFSNLARNPLLEQRWPAPRPFFSRQVLARLGIYPLAFSNVVASLLDPAAAWYWNASIKAMHDSFWAVFGWGEVRLESAWLYRFLALASLAGLLGFIVRLVRREDGSGYHPGVLLLLITLVLLTWGIALTSNLLQESLIAHLYIPLARYGYPVIIPTLLILCSGWLVWTRLVDRAWPQSSRLAAVLFVAAFLALDLLSLARIVQFYG